jgi:hypothetical protein
MTGMATARPPNPFARAADALPYAVAVGASVGGRVLGALFALWYAYDQYDTFDGRWFAGTWTYTAIVAALGLVTLAPLPGRLRNVVPVSGAAVLAFAGAILTYEPQGWALLASGAVAWVGASSMIRREGASGWTPVLGLAAGAAVAIGVVPLIVLTVGG